MALSNSDKEDIRGLFREEIGDLRVLVREELCKEIDKNPKIDKIDDLVEEVKLVRQVQGQQSLQMSELRADVRDLKTNYRTQSVLLEDLESRFTTVCEAIDDNLNVQSQVRNHEVRLTSVESLQTLMRRTLREHSRRLNLLTNY